MPYNKIYEDLVKRSVAANEPLIGFIAYALYKKQKTEFYEKYAAAGNPVTPEQREVFHAAFTEVALVNLESQARQLLFAFADDYVESDIEAREKSVIEKSVSMKVDSIIVRIDALATKVSTEISTATTFWKAFWPSTAASLAFLLVTAGVALAWALTSPETMTRFLKVFAPST